MKKDVIHADSVITGQHRNLILKEHIKTIHEGKRYTCGMCDYNGADRSGLRKHKLRKHNL